MLNGLEMNYSLMFGNIRHIIAYYGTGLWFSSIFCGWEFAQIKWATVSDLLRSLRSNERLWVNCSDGSYQKSNCKRIVQVAHIKRATVSKSLKSLATVSESLRSLAKNERNARWFKRLSVSVNFFCIKQAIRWENWWANSQPLFKPVDKHCTLF